MRNYPILFTVFVASMWDTYKEHTSYPHWGYPAKDACNGQLRQDNTNLKRHIIKLRGECSRLQSVALTAQEGAPWEMENSGRAAKEDRVVWEDLAKLQDGLRSWARNYSNATVGSSLDCVSARQKNRVVKGLKRILHANCNSVTELMLISLNKVPPVIVQMLLAKDVFQSILADSFFAHFLRPLMIPNRLTGRVGIYGHIQY